MSEKEWVKVAVANPIGQVHVVTKDSNGEQVVRTPSDGVFEVSKADFDELGPDGRKVLKRGTKADVEAAPAPKAMPVPAPGSSEMAKAGLGQKID